MTKTQTKMIEAIKRYIEREDLFHSVNPNGYEIKKFEVTQLEHGLVAIYSETGLKNDEGTLAAVFARTRRHIFIGPRGGVSAFGEKNGKRQRLTGFSQVMIWGSYH